MHSVVWPSTVILCSFEYLFIKPKNQQEYPIINITGLRMSAGGRSELARFDRRPLHPLAARREAPGSQRVIIRSPVAAARCFRGNNLLSCFAGVNGSDSFSDKSHCYRYEARSLLQKPCWAATCLYNNVLSYLCLFPDPNQCC